MKARLIILGMVLRRFAEGVRVGYPGSFAYLRDGLKIVVMPSK